MTTAATSFHRRKNNNMQIVAKFVQIAVLVSISLSCTKTPTSNNENASSKENLYDIKSLIAISDSIAEINPDSCLKITPLICDTSIKDTPEEVKAIALQINGVAQITKGNTEEGFRKISEAHSKFLEFNDSLALAGSYRRMGYGFRIMNRYDDAIKCFVSALTILEEKHTAKDVAYLNNALGLAFMYMENYEKSLEYLIEAKRLYDKENNLFGLSKVSNNLGGTYYRMGQNILALENLEKAYEIKNKIGAVNSIGSTLNNIGLVCTQLKLYDKASDYFNRAIVQYQAKNDKAGEANTLNNLAMVYLERNSLNQAKEVLKRNKLIIDSINTPVFKQEYYDILYQIYSKEGNYKKALEYHVAYTKLKDSTYSQSKQNMVEEMQIKYESQKKEKEIEFLNNLRRVQESKLKMQTYIGTLFGFSFILLVVFSFLLFKKYKSNNAEHNTLKTKQLEVEEKNRILNKAFREVEVKTEQLKKQRDIAKDQMNQIQHQKEEITNSIRYAYRIQSAVLESGELNRTNLPPYFSLFRPKDIVSGDFYWIRELENYSVFAVADCTGHGVPGAFMSLLGVAFLNEIFSGTQKLMPNEILNSLRAKIITALHQNITDPINNDGMDISLLFIDHSREKIYYSGANLSLFLIRKSELIEVNGYKMPVGFYYTMNPFVTHSYDILPGDCIYLATDGFADQFGGPDAKKFRLKGLKNLLMQIADKPLEQQKNILECSFDAWKGNGIQVDDVLVLGIKV